MQISSTALLERSAGLCDCLDALTAEKRRTTPFSTYRLQFNGNFRFADARRLLPYLEKLGISHCYSSPILKARAGSPHGYDIIDHNQLNPEIGTLEEFQQLAHELHARGMGLVLDTVPNHMGVGTGDNPWWQDVLQNGRTSAYADFFDIDWEPIKPELHSKVLIPILGNTYGEELEAGHFKVLLDDDSRLMVRYFETRLPIDPQTVPLIFGPTKEFRRRNGTNASSVLVEFDALLTAMGRLPVNSVTDPADIRRRQTELPRLLDEFARLVRESSEVRVHIEEALRELNGAPGDCPSFDALHELLERQAYRFAFWRVSGEEINYRRFFDINDLVGLRMENPRVFAATHKLMRTLLAEGLISGLRVDHPDGLLDPLQYFMRMQRLYAASRCLGAEASLAPAADGIELDVHAAFAQQESRDLQAPLYLLVEKILEPGEHQPKHWPTDGTVGYDFMNLLNGIFIDRRNERLFTTLYQRVVELGVKVEKLIYESKKLVMRRALASEVNVLTQILDEISNRDRRARDYTRGVLREAIRETIACFPVYRTYIDEQGHVSETDRSYIEQAIDCAKRQNGTPAPEVFDFLRSILLLQGSETDTTIYGYRRQLYFTLKFQQLTGPVMAKGLEDTACYVYNRFISVNEVGGTPAAFGVSISEFHRGNKECGESNPDSMLCSSTHDAKRSEDVRARLNVLSEMPRMWASHVMKWRRVNHKHKITLADGRTVPDNNEEYLLYQTLVGAWPLRIEGDLQWKEFVRRIQQYMEKAMHEAKVNLSWINPNPEYVAGMNAFIEKILAPVDGRKANLFWDSLQKLLPQVMYFGCINSLAQTVLKLTCPGVPDFYQGEELWSFSLVDPDNRRPVDFELRERAADELRTRAVSEGPAQVCHDLLRNFGDGRIKLWVTMRGLNFRRERSRLFRVGRYIPLEAEHGKAEHLVAFAREHAGDAVIVAVPRLSLTLMKGREEAPLGSVWNDTALSLPPEAIGRRLRNVLTGEIIQPGHTLLCREIFAGFPVALLALD
jgi:(1->4)-alpha-D-glucan 1-alpha-D-glucosylmutase